jgi:2-polyprenyl-3-methyl-5-hydroxy-6-metoxy-1,4-benzoquinol methylase
LRFSHSRLGYELSYSDKLTKPRNLSDPDGSDRVKLTGLERFYIRVFGLPDTIEQQQARSVLNVLEGRSFSSLLDVGCRQGHYAIRIARLHPNVEVKGIDIDGESVLEGESVRNIFGLKNLSFEKEDVCSLQATGSYDVVLLLQVMEHLVDDLAALRNVHRVLRNAGILVITVPNLNLKSESARKLRKHVKIQSHFRQGYRPADMERLLTQAGFRIQRMEFLSGKIGQRVERTERFLKTHVRSLFALVYPLLYFLTLLDVPPQDRDNVSTSGMLIVATPSK